MSFEIKSFNQMLGSMVRKIVAETAVSDINPGSVFLSLLEACASNDFENNAAILNVLELLNVDSIRNSDLDNKAADYGITRRTPTPASGVVSVFNTAITKQTASLYSLKPAPIAGQTVLFVTNTKGWSSSGSLYIGRGTTSFEGPIPYTSIQPFSTYSQVNLGSALQKDHLTSDSVINAQGQVDRRIPAGTVIKIPANNQNSEVSYNTLRDAVIPAGEDRVEGVLVVAQVSGSRGNALINTIRQFESLPFPGASVTNTQAFTSGTDVETDTQLRNRIKSHAASLARGTTPAIINAVIGLSDPDENKRVVSAVLTTPVTPGAPSVLYVDDGSGFQPSYTGQAMDTLVAKANGTEEFLQLANYPLPRPQVKNSGVGPFSMTSQMFINVAIDGVQDTVVFETSDFVNISVATVSEVVAAFNAKATLFQARLDNDSSSILLYPLDPDAETIQVMSLGDSDDASLYANSVFNFPTKETSYIALYQNSTRLKQRAKAAMVETISFAAWNLLADGTLSISVDGTPAQTGSFTLADFPGFTSYATLSIEDWVSAFNAKFAGITAVATASQTMQVASNRSGSKASVQIAGGTYMASMFADEATSATGQESQFEINRQTGNIRLLTDVVEGDTISAGAADTKGYVVSVPASTGIFNFDVDAAGRASQMVVAVDAKECTPVALGMQVGDTLTITDRLDGSMRLMASTLSIFRNVEPGNYIFLAPRTGWLNASNTGLFHVVRCGAHTSVGVDNYIEANNSSITPQTVTILDLNDVVVFQTDAYPQVWLSSTLSSPTATSLADLVTSLNKNICGARATIFRTTSVKISSITEQDGSIAIPVSIGRAASVFPATTAAQTNNSPLIATKQPSKDLIGFPKFPSDLSSYSTFFNRAAYPMLFGELLTNATRDLPPYVGAYSEQLKATILADASLDASDIVLLTHGDNSGLMRSIAAKTASDTVGTQQGLPRTMFNYISGVDQFMVMQSLKFSGDDSLVCVLDNDATLKTINIAMARNGQVNSGSASASFAPTTTEFSANDIDNEAGIDFSTLSVWGKTINNTDFSDYAVLMRARNWYASGGTGGVAGRFVVRAAEYGPSGNNLQFSIEYPSAPSQTNRTSFVETPSYSKLSYNFGSGTARATAIPASTTITVSGPVGVYYYDLLFSAGTFTSVQVGDVISFLPGCGVASTLLGQFQVQTVAGNSIRVYNPSLSAGTQTITNPSLVSIFPLTGTKVSDIVTSVNQSTILTAAAIGDDSLLITKSTKEDQYTYTTDATALAHGHNPTVLANQVSVSLFDGINWIRSFSNTNPNFTVKTGFTLALSGVDKSVYSMATSRNEDGTQGEYIKLVPTTVKNVQHHFTQKAMSQLPILSDVSIAAAGKNLQITTKKLGSAGGVQIFGGLANLTQTDTIGDTTTAADTTGSYLLTTTAAYPNSFAVGDMVKVQNRAGVRRQSTFEATDRVSVVADGLGNARYLWQPKTTNFSAATTITITDVGASYGKGSGSVFRWQHSAASGETLGSVNVGDILCPYGMTGSWKNSNMAKVPAAGLITGFPIVAVDDVGHTMDILCPYGRTMTSTAIGAGTLSIFASPQVPLRTSQWAPMAVVSTSRTANVVTMTCAKAHGFSTGDFVTPKGSAVIADGDYGITVTSPIAFTIASVGSNASEGNIGVTVTAQDRDATTFRLELLGVNGLVRLSSKNGEPPRFFDFGVAVDDYITISGTTFNSSNNGTFRVLAVSNEVILFENPSAVATTDDAGVPLKDIDDISFFEGDSALNNDTLYVQNLQGTNWFSFENTGSFNVDAIGSDTTTHRPYIRVANALAKTEVSRDMSVSLQGLYVVENDAHKFSSYRRVKHSTVSSSNGLQRSLYLQPDTRSYKFSESNGTYISHTGKLGFDLNPTIGTDGYTYYTGLLRRVQRTVDGFGPDSINFPERRAVGSRIETMPPLIKNIAMVFTVTTEEGVTIQDVTTNVKSAVIDYINSLGVGQDVILAAVIAKVMQVRGVAAITFNVPAPSEERISVAQNEKAVITANNIGIN